MYHHNVEGQNCIMGEVGRGIGTSVISVGNSGCVI
jgi:hypothetical protein